MNMIDENIIKDIRADVVDGIKSVGKISSECFVFERRTKDISMKVAYLRIAKCTNRNQMILVIDGILFNKTGYGK